MEMGVRMSEPPAKIRPGMLFRQIVTLKKVSIGIKITIGQKTGGGHCREDPTQPVPASAGE